MPALANALGFQFYKEGREEPRQQLLNYLRHKQLLLVLDNVEHLLDEQTARLSSDILAAAPEVKLLATSRARLNVRGEQLYPGGGMRWPQNGGAVQNAGACSGIQLFRQSADRVQPGSSPAPTTSPTLCAFANWCRAPWPWNWRPPGWNCSPLKSPPGEIERSLDFWRLIYATCRNANGVSGRVNLIVATPQ
ncbi:MAG: hypothetical protein IPL78_18035 [Chloroflexi bacterium]|nr:hypothetical protein [Chloroflexota bacterium]